MTRYSHPLTAINILYLDHAPIWGGAEVVLVNLLGELDRERFNPLVATPLDSPLVMPLVKIGVDCVPVAYGRLNQAGIAMPANLLWATWQIARLTRAKQIHLLHSNTVRTHIVGALAALLARKPLIWTLHDNTFPVTLYRLLASIPRRIVAVAGWLQEAYAPLGGADKFRVIPNGLRLDNNEVRIGDIRAELNISAHAPVIIYVGRLIESKGAHLLLQAAPVICQTFPDAHFVLVGGPDPDVAASLAYAQSLALQAEASSVQKQIHLLGQRSDVDRLLASADLFVYPATAPEGLPTVLLEAMMHRLPVVATAVGGAREIVQDGVTGRLVAHAEAKTIAQAILEVLADRRTAAQMGEQGLHRLMSEFRLDIMVERYTRLYKSCIG